MSDSGRPETQPDEKELAEAAWDAQRDTYFLFEPGAGKAIRWNRAFRELTGYTDEEIARMPAPASYYGPEDLERAGAFLERVVETGTGTIELDLICKDGRRIPTEYNVSVVLDREGAPRYLISIGRDVSERKRAEDEVRLHRERLMGFMDSASESFHLVDADLRIIEINERAMRALREGMPGLETKEGIVGRSLLDVYPFLRGEADEDRFRNVIRTGEPTNFDSSAEHPVHGTVHMIVQAFRVGADLGIIANDISDRMHAEEERLHLERQMQHAQKLESLGILAGGIAHDFNNLLVGVLGGTDLALKHIAPTSPARGLLEDVIRVAHQAADLANQMLAYSGKGRFVVAPLDLSTLVREISQLVDSSVTKKVQTHYELDEHLPATEVDSAQISQIVLNLVINAAEAVGEEAGTVTIATGSMECTTEQLAGLYLGGQAEEGRFVYLQVKDTGVGMDRETVRKIFDPFFTTKSTGRGLGLAAALGIIRGHRGAVEVDSAPGRGTTITVFIPASERKATNRPEASEEQGDWTGSGTVLLVDDEEVVRNVGAEMLGGLGFDVLVAEDGRRGVEVYRQRADEIVLVVLDLTMPEMSGDDVLREIREIRGDAAVLISSGFDEQDVSRRFAEGSPSGFIQKPYLLETLTRKVREILVSSMRSGER